MVRFEDALNMNYDLDPKRMVVHMTGTARFTFRAEEASGPTEFLVADRTNSLVDISRDPRYPSAKRDRAGRPHTLGSAGPLWAWLER